MVDTAHFVLIDELGVAAANAALATPLSVALSATELLPAGSPFQVTPLLPLLLVALIVGA